MINERLGLERPIKISPLKGRAPQEVQACPKCHSVFINQIQCESCGLQFAFDPYGEPLDEKSFYAIREAYRQSQKILGLDSAELWNKLYPEKRQQYQRNLIHRYRLLVDYFCLEARTDRRRKIFLIELQDMIAELIKLNIDKEVLWRPLDLLQNKDDQILLQMINQAIIEGQKDYDERSEQTFLTKKWFGVLSTNVVIRISLFCVAMLSLGTAYFKYLTI
jgi:hypothetical protein